MRHALFVSVLAAFGSFVGSADAAEEFDLKVDGSKVIVSTKAGWLVNKEYPWKLTAGQDKIDKSKFTLSEKEATVAAPKGKSTLKGGVCTSDKSKCKTIEVEVDVR